METIHLANANAGTWTHCPGFLLGRALSFVNTELHNIQPTLTWPQCTDTKSNALISLRSSVPKCFFLSLSWASFYFLDVQKPWRACSAVFSPSLSKLTDYSARLLKDRGRQCTSMHCSRLEKADTHLCRKLSTSFYLTSSVHDSSNTCHCLILATSLCLSRLLDVHLFPWSNIPFCMCCLNSEWDVCLTYNK